MTPRRSFHLLLGAIFVPLLSLPLVWGATLYWLRRAADADGRRWAKRLLALALVDTIVVVTAGVLVAAGPGLGERPSAAAADPVVIGVRPDLSFGGPGARIEEVLPGGPAAASGLEAGDVLTRVGAVEIADHEELRDAIRELEPGVPVSLELERGRSTLAVRVTPQRSSEVPRTRLFEPAGSQVPCFPRPSGAGFLQLALVLATTAVLAAFVSRRGSARAVWGWGLAVVSATAAAYALPAGACVLLGGQSAAGVILSLWGSSLALAGAALVAHRFVSDRSATPATRSWTSAVALGAWYMLTGAARVAVLVAAVTQLVGQEAGSHPIESLARDFAAVQGPGLLLLVIPAVLFAPIGEELAFRGLLQPALGARLGPFAAVAVTAVIFAAMHPYYGLKLPIVVLIGAVLGWARVVTGGLRAPIVLHVLVNAVAFVGFFLGDGAR